MKNVHILATLPQPIQTATERFSLSYPKYGSCSLDLTAHGDYSLHVGGANTEGSVRRTAEYKAAYNKVTMAMLHAYEAENRRYTSMHRNMPKVETRGFFERKLTSMAPNKYHRKTFAFPKPTKADVEKDLREEVVSLNYAETTVNDRDYCCQYLDSLTEARQQTWYEAKSLFDKIEDAREERENSKLFADFQAAYNKEKDFLAGKDTVVYNGMSQLKLSTNVEVPYNLSLDYQYSQAKRQMIVAVTVEDGINVPTFKAVVLASGKISIKNKLVKETIQDKTDSTLSLVYTLAAHIFNISPNIEYLRIGLYERTRQNPLLFVEFNRDAFSRVKPRLVGLHADILGYPHVIDFKTKGDAIEISSWDQSRFDKEVKAVCAEKDKERPSTSGGYQEIGNGKICISVAEARKLCRFVADNADIRHAISMAEDNHVDEVVISNKYKGVLGEIQNV